MDTKKDRGFKATNSPGRLSHFLCGSRKSIALAIFALIFFFKGTAQQTAESQLQAEIIRMLQADGTLLTDDQKKLPGDQNYTHLGLWKNERQKRRRLENNGRLQQKLLAKFDLPSFCKGESIITALTFKNKSLSLVGSYVIRNKNIAVINQSKPWLPILTDGYQMQIANPQDEYSHFRLNYTTSKLFDAELKGEQSSSFKEYYNLKFQENFKQNNTETQQITIGAGQFTNRLATLCEDVKKGELSRLDFAPVYAIYDGYRQGIIINGDQIIHSFNGMCFYSKKGVTSKESYNIDTALNTGLDVYFAKISASAKAKWSNATDTDMQRGIYQIYMFRTPDLITLPSVDEIIKTWENLTPNASSITFPNGNSIPLNGPLIAKVKFGPVPNADMIQLIKVDEKSWKDKVKDNPFISSLRLVTDPGRYIPNDDGTYTFDLEITRNNNYIQQNYTSKGPIINMDVPIKIYIDNAIGNKMFIKEYDPINIQTERYPVPEASDEFRPNKTDEGYQYNGQVHFIVPPGSNLTVASNTGVKIVQVAGLPPSVAAKLTSDLNFGSFILRGINEYAFNFTIPADAKYFDIDHRYYEPELLLRFYTVAGHEYFRKLSIKIIGPKDLWKVPTNITSVTIKDNTQLLAALNKEAVLSNGIIMKDKLTEYSNANAELDILAFVEFLKNENKLSVQDTGYLVDKSILDLNKL